jgi:hypothetical protein
LFATEKFSFLFLRWNDLIPRNAERKGLFVVGIMNYVYLLSFTFYVIFINLAEMIYSRDDDSYEEVEHLRTEPPPQTMNDEVTDIVPHSPNHNEVQWLMTKKPSQNERYELATKIECEHESSKRKDKSKISSQEELCNEAKEVFGPYSREICLSVVTSYVEMLHENKVKNMKKRDCDTKDNKWFLINYSDLKKAKKDLEKSYKSCER